MQAKPKEIPDFLTLPEFNLTSVTLTIAKRNDDFVVFWVGLLSVTKQIKHTNTNYC